MTNNRSDRELRVLGLELGGRALADLILENQVDPGPILLALLIRDHRWWGDNVRLTL